MMSEYNTRSVEELFLTPAFSFSFSEDVPKRRCAVMHLERVSVWSTLLSDMLTFDTSYSLIFSVEF